MTWTATVISAGKLWKSTGKRGMWISRSRYWRSSTISCLISRICGSLAGRSTLLRLESKFRPGRSCFSTRTPCCFFENLLAYQAEPKEEMLEYCRLAVRNCYLLGMPEYGQEVEKFLQEHMWESICHRLLLNKISSGLFFRQKKAVEDCDNNL